MAGMIGHGDAFVLRDPAGIRPAFYYQDDEVVVVASERPVIQTVFNVDIDKVKEIDRGHALIIKKDGEVSMSRLWISFLKNLVLLKEFIFPEEVMLLFIRKEKC